MSGEDGHQEQTKGTRHESPDPFRGPVGAGAAAGLRLLGQLIAGLDYLALSLAAFALAVLTSLLKSGVLAHLAPTRERA